MYDKHIRKTKTKEILIILVFFGTRMKQDYQDDSSFSSWYPIKTAFNMAKSQNLPPFPGPPKSVFLFIFYMKSFPFGANAAALLGTKLNLLLLSSFFFFFFFFSSLSPLVYASAP